MSSTTSLPRRRLGRTRAATALAAAGALIMSAGVIGLIASPASADHKDSHDPGGRAQGNPSPGKPSTPPGQTDHKSYVCKYVSTPGAGEVLQTGQNPIWVDNHSLLGHHGPTFVGQEFSDKHGRSVVIIANTPRLTPEPGIDRCTSSTSTSTPTTPGGGGGLQDLTPAVTFNDADCDTLGSEDWDGTLEAFLDYEETGEVGPGETVTVEAMIEPAYANTYEFAPGAQTEFTHTFDDITLADCVAGEETVIPKPEKPEPKPDKEPTVKGVEVVVPPAAPPAAAPTAVAAGLGSSTESPLQSIAQMLVAGGMLLLMAGAWIGLGRRESGTHEA